MSLARRIFLGTKPALLAVVFFSGGVAWAASPADAPFLAENDAAMTKMMEAMTVKPTGDVDRDFVASMAPHHQGAIDMAKAELRYGKNEQLRRMAQEIIVTQQQEIATMYLAIGEKPPSSEASPDQPASMDSTAVPPMSRHSMQMNEKP